MKTGLPHFNTLLGAIVAVADNLLIISLLLARLAGKPRVEYWLGVILILSIVPLLYLLISSSRTGQPLIYYTWLGLMIFFLCVELLLDYVLQVQFRTVRWMAITYVMLFFGATGGMIGVASRAGRGWMLGAVLTFLIMAAVAFYQRAKTGL